jgi:hypothetical protein
MDASVDELWDDYLRAERDRVRSVMMPALDRFIDRLLQEPASTWQAWARDVASAVSDRGAETPIRFPLFRRVLLPALAEGVTRVEPGCARWLASFESLLLETRDNDLPTNLQTAVGLLTEAVRVDPTDDIARKRLVDRHAAYLEYTLHELPAGVLYGHDGATAEQCDELLELLADFKRHVEATAQTDRFARLVQDCDFYFRAYAGYRRSGLTSSFAQYVQRQRLA